MITREQLEKMYDSINDAYCELEDYREDLDVDSACTNLSLGLDYLAGFLHTIEVKEKRERFKTLLNGFMKEYPSIIQDREKIEGYASRKGYSAILYELSQALKKVPTDSDTLITPEDVHEVGELFELGLYLMTEDKESD